MPLEMFGDSGYTKPAAEKAIAESRRRLKILREQLLQAQRAWEDADGAARAAGATPQDVCRAVDEHVNRTVAAKQYADEHRFLTSTFGVEP